MSDWFSELMIKKAKKDYNGYHYMPFSELIIYLKELNPKWLSDFEKINQLSQNELLTFDELKKELFLVELKLASMVHVGNEVFEEDPFITFEERKQRIQKFKLQKVKLQLQNLIIKKIEENPKLAIVSVEKEKTVEELIQELLVVELQLETMSHIGNEVLEDLPLTGTIEERKQKDKLRFIRSSLKEMIVDSFKKCTNMSFIPLDKRKFLYSQDEYNDIKRFR